MAGDPLAALKRAAEGLVFPSESDAPLEVFAWDAACGPDPLRAVTAHAGGRKPVVESDPAELFAQLDETDDAAGFRRLRTALERTLTGLRLVRVGKVKVDVYLVGRTRDGRWAGVHTTSVET